MTPAEIELLASHAAPAALHAARLLPVALVSPFLGGPAVPAPARVGLSLALGVAAYAACGEPHSPAGAWLVTGLVRELALGVVLAFVASVPVEAARAAGRLVDTLRGATLSELHVAPVRQRESAAGDLLAQWVIVLAATSGGERLVVSALLGTFHSIPVGAALSRRPLEVVLLGGAELLACAAAMGAPAAAGLVAADLAVSATARVSPLLGAPALAQPARAAAGLVAVGVAAAMLAGRLTALVATSADLLRLVGAAR